jgi:hypothetical protein
MRHAQGMPSLVKEKSDLPPTGYGDGRPPKYSPNSDLSKLLDLLAFLLLVYLSFTFFYLALFTDTKPLYLFVFLVVILVIGLILSTFFPQEKISRYEPVCIIPEDDLK